MFRHFAPLDGFHAVEKDEQGSFIWAKGSFRLRTIRAGAFVELRACYYGDAGTLTIRSRRGSDHQVALGRGWQTYVLGPVDALAGEEIDVRVNPLIDVPGDSRELGLMLRQFELFDDPLRFEMLSRSQENLKSNQQEYEAGQVLLQSVPPYLRINMEVRCNIPETSQACAYCAWDWAKEMERGSPAFTLKRLEDLGDIYRCSTHINDCSIGEPTMHKQFGEITAQIDRDGKHFAMTTNGQLLTPKRRRELVGRNLELYVSIDSFTSAGYTRYRNDRLDDIMQNLAALGREKRDHNNLPRVCVSCIVMRSNVDELPQFLSVMSELGVDEVKLRALYLDDNVNPVIPNGGYRFDYAKELLTSAELAEVADPIRGFARDGGPALYIEWEGLPDYATQPGAPLCSEPWKTVYVLRRGIMPCCYATEPIAKWHEQEDQPLETFVRNAVNSPAMQKIRRELAHGRLAGYCLRTPSCPILKQMRADGRVAPASHGLAAG